MDDDELAYWAHYGSNITDDTPILGSRFAAQPLAADIRKIWEVVAELAKRELERNG